MKNGSHVVPLRAASCALILAGIAFLAFIPGTIGQGIPHALSPVLGPTGSPKPGATVSFCTHPANAVPCTNFANIYTDIGLTQLINQALNPVKTDGLGNVPAFYTNPGIYDETISGAGISPPAGPYVINIPAATNGTNTWSGTNTFSQQIVSTVTVGTAPFAISSPTLVNNLNVQFHGGQVAPSSAIVGITDTQTLTNKSLTAPTIDGFSAGHVAILNSTANFGVALGTQTIVSSVPATGAVFVSIQAVQTLLGVGCTNVTNTVGPSLSYTAPGGTAETYAPGGIGISIGGNGTIDTGDTPTLLSPQPIIAKAGTAITFATVSTLASTGCSTVPQYTIFTKAIF